MEVKIYSKLPDEAKQIRTKVFVEEQGFTEEFDRLDDRCVHIVLFDNKEPIGTCRYFVNDGDCYSIGRVAVVKERRGTGVGERLMAEAQREIEKLGGRVITLSAQRTAEGFYQRQGYEPFGEEYYEEHCPHIKMKKNI